MDMNIRKNILYFTVEDSDALYEYNATDGSHTFVENIGDPTLVSLDWITDNVYFVDKSAEPSIGVCHMANRVCITLVKRKPRDIIKGLAVDPVNKQIFFAVLRRYVFDPAESFIYSANMDGTNVEVVASGKMHISALACDHDRHILYFTEWNSRAIWSVNYDGSKLQVVIGNENILRPIGLDLFEGTAGVINIGSNVVVRCKIYGDKACQLFKLNVNNPENIFTVQESRQRMVRDNCEDKNCSAICVAKDRWADCVCDYADVVEVNTHCSHYSVSICTI